MNDQCLKTHILLHVGHFASAEIHISGARGFLTAHAFHHFLNRVDMSSRTRDMVILSFAWRLGSHARPPPSDAESPLPA